jgi:hypothetical protein
VCVAFGTARAPRARFQNNAMILIFTLLLRVDAFTNADASAFCLDSPGSPEKVSCSDDKSAAVFCRGNTAYGWQDCNGLGCRAHLFVPDTCSTKTATFQYANAYGQRPGKWRWVPKNV